MIFKVNYSKVKKTSYSVYIVILSILLICMITSPKLCIDGCLNGLDLFVKALFPTLFPFLVLCNLIISLKGGEFYGKLLGPIICKPLNLPQNTSIVILLSFLCGYPLGAKYTCELYEKKQISFHTAENLLNIASNASPLFILGTISIIILKNTSFSLIILTSNYISCFIMGLLLKDNTVINYNKKKTYISTKENSIDFSSAFFNSVDDAIKVTLKIGGLIVIFSVLNTMILKCNLFSYLMSRSSLLKTIVSFFMSVLELTNGCVLLATLDIPTFLKLGLISFGISFSGICVILQIYSFIAKHGFSIRKYIIRKLLHGCISFSLALILYFIFFRDLTTTTSTLNSFYKIDYSVVYVAVCILLLSPVIIRIFKKHQEN